MRAVFRCLALACSIGVIACSSSTSSGGNGTPSTARTLAAVQGDHQTAVVGTTLTTQPTVKVTDSSGNAVAGSTVTFAVSGGGTLTATSATTNTSGVATAPGWTLGTVPGSNTLTATLTGATGSPVTFTASATTGPAASIVKVAGDSQSAVAGQAVAINPKVKVADQYGNPVFAAVTVFAVASGGGSVGTGFTSTATDGTASTTAWLLGSVGANTLAATSNGHTVTFTATALAALNALQYAGTYTGTWTNTTFASTGTGSVVIAINAATSTATATINVTGPVLGTAGVGQQVKNATYGATSAAFTGTVTTMGDVTASIDATGHITASGINVPEATVTRWDAQGTITALQLSLTFTVTFTSGPQAIGTIVLNKAP